MPVRTHGLTHLALDVRDPEASYRFYRTILGSRVTWRDADSIEMQTPGRGDYVVLQRAPRSAGKRGGVSHFGFTLVTPKDIEKAIAAIEEAGGEVTERGFFTRDEPYVFFRDPDGYEVEIWYQPRPR